MIKELLKGFVTMIFPQYCTTCMIDLVGGEKYICTKCIYKLPKSKHLYEKENALTRKLWGKVPVEHGMAYLKYSKKGAVQRLLQHIKYKGGSDLSYMLGKWYGEEIKQHYPEAFDVVVPVPLHRDKMVLRGYNQSESFARGIAEALEIPMEAKMLVRKVATTTQTRKKRYERWENVKGIFQLTEAHSFSNKHVLLVDDVITTGATIEACISALQQATNIKISVAAIAAG